MFLIRKLKKILFQVDVQILGIYRILFGSVLFYDLISRLSVINLFYTNKSIFPTSYILSSPYKVLPFTLLTAFNQPWEVKFFLFSGLISCVFFILGYKTKLMQIITSIVVLSFHNKITTLENGGDMVVNNFIIWSLFLPLGISISIDSLKKSLHAKIENSPKDINNYKHRNFSINSIAYFACLFQIALIYFFNYKTKSGTTWNNYTSLHYFFELDSFITPVGYWMKDILSQGLKSFLTRVTLLIEMSIPFLIFLPFFTKYIRTICFLILLGFHLSIALVMNIGTFSWIMIAVNVLLLSGININYLKSLFGMVHGSPITLIYDSDCGLCHYIVRIFKRLDVFGKISIYGNEWKNLIDPKYDIIRTQSILVFKNSNPNIIYSKHNAFFQLLNRLPFGFLFGWILLIPGISHLVNLCYKYIAENRAKISKKFGLNECGVNYKVDITLPSQQKEFRFLKISKYLLISLIVIALLVSNIQRSITVNEPYKSKYGFRETNIGRKVLNYLRMKQDWRMFAPSVLKKDIILVSDVMTINNKRIDPLTGEVPLNIDSVDFQKMNINYGQFVRKFMKRSVKDNRTSILGQYEKWLKMPIVDINGIRYSKAKSFKVWKLTQYSSKPGRKPNIIRKELVLEYPNSKLKGKKIPVNKRKITKKPKVRVGGKKKIKSKNIKNK